MKYYIGIDIGLKGGMTLMNEDSKIIKCFSIPTIEVMVGKKKKIRNQYDIQSIHSAIEEWQRGWAIEKAGMERLRAIPNQSSQTAFSMGGGAMLFKTLFTVYEIPFIEFEPRAWQQKIFKNLGIQYKKDTTKQASIQAARQLWPGASFLPNARCRVPSDGMTDSACIALYTRINNEL